MDYKEDLYSDVPHNSSAGISKKNMCCTCGCLKHTSRSQTIFEKQKFRFKNQSYWRAGELMIPSKDNILTSMGESFRVFNRVLSLKQGENVEDPWRGDYHGGT